MARREHEARKEENKLKRAVAEEKRWQAAHPVSEQRGSALTRKYGFPGDVPYIKPTLDSIAKRLESKDGGPGSGPRPGGGKGSHS
jgi:hypothetical protein